MEGNGVIRKIVKQPKKKKNAIEKVGQMENEMVRW